VWKSKFYGAFVLNRRVVLHAIDTTPARWRGDAGSSPLDRARTAASSPRSAPDALVDFHTGIDRLTMFLTNKNSIREVLLFPAMKPEASPPPPPPPGDDADAKIRALCAQVAQFGVKPCCGP
jgi:hypothetical protein